MRNAQFALGRQRFSGTDDLTVEQRRELEEVLAGRPPRAQFALSSDAGARKDPAWKGGVLFLIN